MYTLDVSFLLYFCDQLFHRAAQVVKVLIALAVFCTFGLQFYVCLDIGWNLIKHHFEKKALLANYIMRTVLVIGAGKHSETSYFSNYF